jgi:hypothetical protein
VQVKFSFEGEDNPEVILGLVVLAELFDGTLDDSGNLPVDLC